MRLIDFLEYVARDGTIRVYSVTEKRQLFKGSKQLLQRDLRVTSRNIRKSGISLYRSNRWEVGINIEVF